MVEFNFQNCTCWETDHHSVDDDHGMDVLLIVWFGVLLQIRVPYA